MNSSDEQQRAVLGYEIESAATLIVHYAGAMPYLNWFPLKEAVTVITSHTDLQRQIDIYGIELVCRRVSAKLTENGLFVGARRNIAGKSQTAVFHSKDQHNRFWRNREKLPRHQRGVKTEYDTKHCFEPEHNWRG